MRTIDLQTWSRREHFRKFNSLDLPHFSICAQVDLKDTYAYAKEVGVSVNIAIVYLLAGAANEIPAFCQRIRGDTVIEHEVVHPSTTILTEDKTFTFCTIPFSKDFRTFEAKAQEVIAFVKGNIILDDEPGQDDLLFMTAIPWISFTSMTQPINELPTDSVPRIAWGKFYQDGEALRLPVGVQAHHALIDGFHVGEFYSKVQAYMNDPKSVFG
jgi:chloramphenicol O-acetyltransferase type A